MLHWIKFNVVGVIGFALQSATLFVLTHSALRVSYLVATAVAVELAVLNNFIWHQRWTWSDRPATTKKEILWRFAKFNSTNGLVSIAGNLLLMSLLVGHFGLSIMGANVVTVVACSILGFILAHRIAFYFDRPSTSAPGADRGPRASSPRGVVVATGQMLNLDLRSFRFQDGGISNPIALVADNSINPGRTTGPVATARGSDKNFR